MERLAREICWRGFARPENSGMTKARYWKEITEGTRQKYRVEARQLVFLVERIPMKILERAKAAK